MNLNYLTDLTVQNVNRYMSRCYYIPCNDYNDLNKEWNMRQSVSILNGEWQFKYFPNGYDIDDKLFQYLYTDKINVPSNPQLLGYDTPLYSGGKYPFCCNPPYIPNINPAFCYRKTICIDELDNKKYIVFEGVDSAFYLYINSKFVGYATCSHAMNEFDITDFLIIGENTIDVIVFKWSVGSYLEAQDKWRLSGIFRNVYILNRPKKHIVDYKIETNITGSNSAYIKIVLLEGCNSSVEFLGIKKKIAKGKEAIFEVENIEFWSAENPILYPIILSTEDEYIKDEIGIREIYVKDKSVFFNNQPIKFKGVNRHEFNCKNGFVVSETDMINDLKLMKEHNINAIRTSHYPNSPIFYKMCDKFGFYIIDEADIECHGLVLQNGGYEEKLFLQLSDNDEWTNSYLDRIEKLISRDKNRPCVVIWSLGNESGYGKNFEKVGHLIRELDKTRLTHYESIWHRRDEEIYYTKNLDLVSRMYPEYEYMENIYPNDKKEKRPLILCEYAHAMGNGPGGLKKYWDIINNNINICGAFVWEWNDHGILNQDKGYVYGSYFKHKIDDKNFCIDGLVGPDREIKPGIKELKIVLADVDVTKVDKNNYVIYNRYYFNTLDNIDCSYVIKRDGEVILQNTIDVKEIYPGDFVKVHISYDYDQMSFYNIVFTFRLRNANQLLQKGHVVLEKGFILEEANNQIIAFLPCENVSTTENKCELTFNLQKYTYVFNKNTGELKNIKKSGNEIFLSPLKLNIRRAPTDNDVNYYNDWIKTGVIDSEMQATSIYYKVNNNILNVTVKGFMSSINLKPPLNFIINYFIYSNGCIEVKCTAEVSDQISFLPRFGLTFAVNKEYSNYEYLGYGELQSYCDMHLASYKDWYLQSVVKDFVSYLKPQESSSHYGVTTLKVLGKDEIAIMSNCDFSFSVIPYSIDELCSAKYNWELQNTNKTVISIDNYFSGIGSNSCGPMLDDCDRVNQKLLSLDFKIKF